MNLVGLRCPCRPGVELPLDHYRSGACPRPPFPLEEIDGMLERQHADDFHADGRITATRLLGCPRQTILLDTRPVFLDLRRTYSAYVGTERHAAIRQRTRGAFDELKLDADLFGMRVAGICDKLRHDMTEIVDWKFHGSVAQQMKWKRHRAGQPDRETAAQLNIYRLLIARSILHVADDEFRPKLTAWHMAMVSAGRGPGEPAPVPKGPRGWVPEEPPPAAFMVTLPIMSEREIAALRPFDEDDAPGTQPYTVTQIVKMYADYYDAVARGEDADAALKAHVPLVGRGVWGGKMCTRYCAALEICDRVEGVRR